MGGRLSPVSASNTIPFEAVPTLTPEQSTSVDQEGGSLDLTTWVNRGRTIRGGDNVYQCLANLTAALDLVGQLNNVEYNGAAGALSLLPTAGALLGAPTREMWIVYKLVPIAGLLSMFLSLGASITPSNVGDYDPSEPFSYGGFMPTTHVRTRPETKRPPPTQSVPSTSQTSVQMRDDDAERQTDLQREAETFANEVEERAEDCGGGGINLRIAVAMILQFILVICMLIPLWYAQQGAVITWWCRAWGWMYFWYFLVTAVSIFDNFVAAPFTKSWTIRVSRMPSHIKLDETTPKITEQAKRYPTALDAIKANPNINQRLTIPSDAASAYARTCFYVVISMHGISPSHAIAQIIAKFSSVAVFAFGTALFASATLLSISVALMVLCCLLPCGVAGRVAAMWIVAQISKENKPVLHKLVRSESEAGAYFHAIANKRLQLEINGHVILDGRCVKSRNRWLSAETYIGLLAKPYDVLALAERTGSVAMHDITKDSLALPVESRSSQVPFTSPSLPPTIPQTRTHPDSIFSETGHPPHTNASEYGNGC